MEIVAKGVDLMTRVASDVETLRAARLLKKCIEAGAVRISVDREVAEAVMPGHCVSVTYEET